MFLLSSLFTVLFGFLSNIILFGGIYLLYVSPPEQNFIIVMVILLSWILSVALWFASASARKFYSECK